MSPINKRRANVKREVIKTEEDETYVPYGKKHAKRKIRVIKTKTTADIIEIPEFPELKIKIVKRGKLPYACNKCDIGFATKTLLDEHSAIHVLKKIKQPNKRFRCEVCGREFRKLCDIERHTRVHTGEKPCVCNICNKGFQQSHNLSKHLLTHLHLKPFHCEICNKQFGRNDVLSRHLLTHSLDKPVKCPFCSKAFIRQTQLNNHIKNHPHASRVNSTTETQVDMVETEGDMTETEFVAVESKVDPLETKVEPMTETKAEPN